MAWHKYMLNPRFYFEDGSGEKSQLLKISAFPLSLVDKILGTNTFIALHPSAKRQHRFEPLTGQPWAAPLRATSSDTTFVPCP
ncbi:hypothetical protein BDV93DRAFT_580688 [Ceratobasidium sp. AG-I]|nr:hypothetical protein BDV93DRAFT_580688 [Ceratobasidium sp. AG-I]